MHHATMTLTRTDPSQADTYVPVARFTGLGELDTRVRCSECSKVVMRDQVHAERLAAKVRVREMEQGKQRGNKRMQAYLGACGHWHVGHSKTIYLGP